MKTLSTAKLAETVKRRREEEGLTQEELGNLTDTFLLLGKSPDDFGYRVSVSKEDIDEFEDFFGKNHHEG